MGRLHPNSEPYQELPWRKIRQVLNSISKGVDVEGNFQSNEAGMLTNFRFSQTLRVNAKYLASEKHDADGL